MKRLLYRFACWLDAFMHETGNDVGMIASYIHAKAHDLAYWCRP